MKNSLLFALMLALCPLASSAHVCLESADEARQTMLLRQTGESRESVEATLGRTSYVIAAFEVPIEPTDEEKIHAIVSFENAAMRLCLQELPK